MRLTTACILLCLFLPGIMAAAAYSDFSAVTGQGVESDSSLRYKLESYKYTFNIEAETEELMTKKRNMEVLLKKGCSHHVKIDYAGLLITLGYHDAASELLEEISVKHPMERELLVSLSKVYDLKGRSIAAQDDMQLAEKIRPSVRATPDWIHLKVLEAKNLKYMEQGSILGLEINDIPQTASRISREELKELAVVRDRLVWYLKEHIPYAKDQDPVTASLLLDLGKLVALTERPEDAVVVFNLSLKYAWPDQYRQLYYRDQAMDMIHHKWMMRKIKYGIAIGVPVVMLVLAIWVVRRRFRKRKTGPHQPPQPQLILQ